MLRRALVIGLALSAIGLTSCSLFQSNGGYSEEELRDDLNDYSRDFLATVGTAANTIRDQSTDREVGRSALLWQVIMPPQMHEAAFGQDPQASYLGCLVITDLQTQYLTTGDGKALFGDQQDLAVKAAKQLSVNVRKIGDRFVPEGDIPALEEKVADLVENDPIKGRYFALTTRTSITKKAEEQGVLGKIAAIPMSPFSALQGVGDTPAAIREFTETADRMTSVVESMPLQARWQTELLLYDLEDRETIKEGLAAFQEAAASMDRVSKSVEGLASGVDGTLGGVPAAAAAVAPIVTDARGLVDAMVPAAEQLRAGSEVWERILAPDPNDDPADDGPPFDILDWEHTATDIAAMAVQLNELSHSIERLLSPEQLEEFEGRMTTVLNATDQRAQHILDETEQRATSLVDLSAEEARGVVDHAALRLGQLLLGFFLLLSIYRLTIGRKPKPVAAAA